MLGAGHGMGQDNLETAARLEAAYEALSVDDIDLFLTAFSPTARWRLLGNSAGLPFAGIQNGHDGIRAMIISIYDHFKMRDFFVEDVLVHGHSAAVRWSAMATSKDTARQSAIEVFDHIILQDGLIISLTQFFDTAAVADAAGRMMRVAEAR
jgi:ketosteroid isomerase-like protein